MESWRWVSKKVSFVLWACLAALNVYAPFLLDLNPEVQWIAAAVLAVVDVGAYSLIRVGRESFGEEHYDKAAACFVAGLALSVIEIGGACHTARSLNGAMVAPEMVAEVQRQGAEKDLAAEEKNLADIRAQLKTERRESMIEALGRREKASIGRVEILRPKTSMAAVPHKTNVSVGYELSGMIALWLLYQTIDFGVSERGRRPFTSEHRDEQMHSVHERGVQPERGVHVQAVHAVPERSGTPLIQAPRLEAGVNSQAVVLIEDERVQEQSEQGVHEQPEQAVQIVPKGRPVLGLVPKDEFAHAVFMYTQQGKSVRDIAKLLKCSPTTVHNAKKKLDAQGRITTASKG